ALAGGAERARRHQGREVRLPPGQRRLHQHPLRRRRAGAGGAEPGTAGEGEGMKATIVIPTYDEADALPDLLARVLALPQGFHVLVVDDASPDGTGELADAVAAREPRLNVLHRPGKMGLGSAYRDGFTRALREGADAVFEMDADHSHNPKYLPALLEPLRADADVTIGSRYVHGIRVENWPFRRLLLSRFANEYVSLAAGLPSRVVSDATSGFRGYRREVLEAIGL